MFLFPAVAMIFDLKLGESSDQRDRTWDKRVDNRMTEKRES